MLELWIIVGILIVIVGQLGTIISRNDSIAAQESHERHYLHWELLREVLGEERATELLQKKREREIEDEMLRRLG